jgi:hypothetical protein
LWPLCVFGEYFCCCSGGCFVRDCRGLGLCTVGTVDWLAAGECVGGRGSVVTGWGRMKGRDEDRGNNG